jgi:pantothenate kinase
MTAQPHSGSPEPPPEPPTGPPSFEDSLIDDVVELLARRPGRVLLGLAGAPGAGKSTLARTLVRGVRRRLGGRADIAAQVPLDGFHLSNRQLQAIGRTHRKGAPDTFDVFGYLALLERLRREAERVVYTPDFDRSLDEPVAARHAVSPDTRLIVTEGNYLGWDAEGWREIRPLLDELWYLDTPDGLRRERLLDRQLTAVGRTPEAARAWVDESDTPNGELVKQTQAASTRVVRMPC